MCFHLFRKNANEYVFRCSHCKSHPGSVILGHINKTDLTTLVAWQPRNDDNALERD